MEAVVVVGVAIGPREAPPDTASVGVKLVAKKLMGWFKVMRIPEASAPPAVDVKANVAATLVLAATATQSAAAAAAMVNETAATAPPITPDATYAEAVVSALVVTVIPTLGIPDVAKTPDRSVRVMMLLQVASAPPADGVNENVAAADVFAATRSDAAIANEGIGT